MVTTKVSNDMMRKGQEAVNASIVESLDKLGCGYLDFLLVHWPVKDRIKDTWQVMEEYVRQGKVRSIGVCNFNPHHFEDLLAYARIKPVMNQIELHPLHSQEDKRVAASSGVDSSIFRFFSHKGRWIDESRQCVIAETLTMSGTHSFFCFFPTLFYSPININTYDRIQSNREKPQVARVDGRIQAV